MPRICSGIDDIAEGAVTILLSGDNSKIDLPLNIGLGKDIWIRGLAEKFLKLLVIREIHWDTSKTRWCSA